MTSRLKVHRHRLLYSEKASLSIDSTHQVEIAYMKSILEAIPEADMQALKPDGYKLDINGSGISVECRRARPRFDARYGDNSFDVELRGLAEPVMDYDAVSTLVVAIPLNRSTDEHFLSSPDHYRTFLLFATRTKMDGKIALGGNNATYRKLTFAYDPPSEPYWFGPRLPEEGDLVAVTIPDRDTDSYYDEKIVKVREKLLTTIRQHAIRPRLSDEVKKSLLLTPVSMEKELKERLDVLQEKFRSILKPANETREFDSTASENNAGRKKLNVLIETWLQKQGA